MENPEARLTVVGIEGSFGVLHYAVLTIAADDHQTGEQRNPSLWMAEDLLARGFRPVRNDDVEDIVLKAQLADGSMRCQVCTKGLIALLVDDNVVWSRQVDPAEPQTAVWLEAARTRELTIISGDLFHADKGGSADSWKPHVMAKVPTTSSDYTISD
ncbi:hypothetical protein [Arthrobacter nitrophenolicus]|uniref:Uncharacterized protein n=1 Tax=Arthrobacter nitrophenolicus TaxID=683150 RepID=A0A4R5Y6Z0_9MICC|nr:hypothetical protein [Arthrobacter nitrophenolicus]TDL38872.1 hypothetical protein E2R57_08035 [Arthrobacter nitrophenolicus]